MRSGFKRGRIFGINIRIDWSWLFIFFLDQLESRIYVWTTPSQLGIKFKDQRCWGSSTVIV